MEVLERHGLGSIVQPHAIVAASILNRRFILKTLILKSCFSCFIELTTNYHIYEAVMNCKSIGKHAYMTRVYEGQH